MSHTVDRQIAALASKQGGYVTRAQLIARGLLTSEQISYRLRIGRLIRVFNGVYAVGHIPSAPVDVAHAALLACAGRAAIAKWSAAHLWELWPRWPTVVEVITKGDRRPAGLEVHRARLTRTDLRRRYGVWVTSPARTFLDLAPFLSNERLVRMVNDARLARHIRLTVDQLADVVSRFRRHPGAKRLRPLIEAETGRGPTRSQLEDRVQRFIDHFGLPQPEISFTLVGFEVDAFFPVEQVVLQIDGWDVHRTRRAFENDRLIDATILAETGIPTVRVTDERLRALAAGEAQRLSRILERRRGRTD